jgi:hypothetical protein
MGKFTKVKLITVDGRTFTVTLEHAEKILKSKNNKQTNIKLASDTFELTENGLSKRRTKKDTTKSPEQE